MHETSAWTWCTRKTQRDRVEREVGGGIRMGNTCKSMANSCQCMTKTTEYYEVINLQLIKINGKNYKLNMGDFFFSDCSSIYSIHLNLSNPIYNLHYHHSEI